MASNTADNIVFSPFAIEICLGLLLQGAAGETFAVLKNGLHVTGKRNDIVNEYKRRLTEIQSMPSQSASKQSNSKQLNTVFTIANKVYVFDKYKQIRKKFKTLAENQFDSEVASIDFENQTKAARQINNWIEQQTEGKHKNVISADSMHELTRMILVNAVKFKAKWFSEFDAQYSKQENFWISQTESMETTFMQRGGSHLYGSFPQYDCTAMGLRYKDSKLIFLILLPNERDGLPKLEAQLDRIDLRVLKENLQNERLLLHMPKFQIDGQIDLKNILSQVSVNE